MLGDAVRLCAKNTWLAGINTASITTINFSDVRAFEKPGTTDTVRLLRFTRIPLGAVICAAR
jgi:hypothetical protein